ncbi:unnamed protein product [Rotaria magnacalcarata]|uniref:Uncharacterized protein n=3 Tax=Rotaria magnacalcarata TaxID=392030 RepID=A0A815L3E7_9BILA|nr:unnamed protein product [Rotaria magnacalcarata]
MLTDLRNSGLQQRLYREKQKIQYQKTIDSDSDSDSDSTIEKSDDNYYEFSDDERAVPSTNQYKKYEHAVDNYLPDVHDNVDIDDDGLLQHDNSPPLYERSNITTSEEVTQLMKFCIKSNFDKQQVVKMMCLLKSILPKPNRLPTTFRQILNIYVVRRNLSLLTGNDNLFPPFDISSDDRYQTITKEIDHPITLCIHADGAPLIRSTKSAVWPCFNSIVELPPPVREHKSNILTLGLWASTVKPNVNLFLHDIIEQLIDLSKTGTSIFINEHEFKIHIKTQFFVSGLPAKSLFLKTINFNGYFACTKCFTGGIFRFFLISNLKTDSIDYTKNMFFLLRCLCNRQVIYPYQSNNYQSRTHDDFVTIGKQVENNLASGHKRGTSIAGIIIDDLEDFFCQKL